MYSVSIENEASECSSKLLSFDNFERTKEGIPLWWFECVNICALDFLSIGKALRGHCFTMLYIY